jgi:hypothetical protein
MRSELSEIRLRSGAVDRRSDFCFLFSAFGFSFERSSGQWVMRAAEKTGPASRLIKQAKSFGRGLEGGSFYKRGSYEHDQCNASATEQ